MPISGIEQPEIIEIEEGLRLRKYTDDCAFALEWYQDEETLLLVDGVNAPYDKDRLYRMYHYLRDRGEVYFIEIMMEDKSTYMPIGDVTFWQEDMPIVIGDPRFRGKGIGKKVVKALVDRAQKLGFSSVSVAEIYDYNIASKKMFESVGFRAYEKTEKGSRYKMEMPVH